jgi:hypothetical protein
VFKIISTVKLAKRFNLSQRTVQKYAKHIRDVIPLYAKAGAPPVFDKESCDIIMQAATDSNYVMVTPDYRKMLNTEAVLTARRRIFPQLSARDLPRVQ